MEQLKMHSPNMVDQNIEKLAELFPGCVTEAQGEDGKLRKAIDFDLLKQELSHDIVEGPQERYQLNWPGKREALLTANAPIAKTLRPCREESVDFDTTQNLFIEGDNLDALRLLQETYLGKVKMIYIDPPYNTGSDFIYEDDFAEEVDSYIERSNQRDEQGNRLVANTESNGRFHSDWLSMILPRLKLARNLLSEDGAIFISIDDNEVTNLQKVCDEVFGADRFLGLIPVVNNMKGRNDKSFHAQIHEYVVAYAKNAFVSNGLELSAEKRAEYNQTNSDGRKFQWRDLRKRGGADTRRERPNLYYPIYINPENGSVSLKKEPPFSIEALPVKSNGDDGRWRWEKDTLSKRLSIVEGRPVRGKDTWNVSYKVFLGDPESGERREKPKSVWIGSEFSTDSGTKAVNSLLPGIDAKKMAPKAVGQVSRMIQLALKENDIVLDFFSGTATTAHAVMQMNAEDGGNRRFIMVQIPEACEIESEAYKSGFSTISEIGKERVRRAGTSIQNQLAAKGNSRLDVGFRVLKIDSSNMADVYYQPDTMTQEDLFAQVDNVKEDRTEEDLLFQVMLDWGVDLTLPIRRETVDGKTVFFVADNALVACFDQESGINEDFVKELAKFEPLRLVFRDAGFASDSTKINVEQVLKQLSPNTDVKSI